MAETKDFTVRMLIQPVIEQIENMTKPIEQSFERSTNYLKEGLESASETFEEDFAKVLEKMGEEIDKSFGKTVSDLQNIEGTLGKGLKEVFAGMAKGGEGGGVVGALGGGIESIVNLLSGIAPELMLIGGFLVILIGIIGAVMEPIGKGIGMLVTILAMPFKILGTMMLMQMMPFFDVAIKASMLLTKFFLDLQGKEGEAAPLDILGGGVEGIVGIIELDWDKLASGSKSFVDGLISFFVMLLPLVEILMVWPLLLKMSIDSATDSFNKIGEVWDGFTEFVGGIVGWFEELDVVGEVTKIWDEFSGFVQGILDWFTTNVLLVEAELGKIWAIFATFVQGILDWFTTNDLNIDTEMNKIWKSFTGFIDGIVGWFDEKLGALDFLNLSGGAEPVGGEKEPTEGIIESLVGGVGNFVEELSKYIPGVAGGGFVAEGGVAVIHKGETIVPSNSDINSGLESAFQSFKSEGTDPLIVALGNLTEEIGRSKEDVTSDSSTRGISALGPQTVIR